MKNSNKKFSSITPCQASIAGAFFLSFFVLWFLWASVGERVLFWFEKHPATGSWAQAFFGALAIVVALGVPYLKRSQEIKDKYKDNLTIARNDFDSNLMSLILLLNNLKGRKTVIENNKWSNPTDIDWVEIYISTFDIYKIPDKATVKNYLILNNNFSSRYGMMLSSFEAIRNSLLSHKNDHQIIGGDSSNDIGFDLVNTINENLDWLSTMIFELSRDYFVIHHNGKDIFKLYKSEN